MKYSPRFFRDGMPEWKRKKDPLLCRIFYRPLSFVFASCFAELGFSANDVSYINVVLGLIASAFFAINMPIIGAILVNVWLVLDCVDGNIARSIGKQKYGEFADALGGYSVVAFLFPCLGLCAFHRGGLLIQPGNMWIVFWGGMAAGFHSLTRVNYQKYLNVSLQSGYNVNIKEDGSNAGIVDKLRIKINECISIGGMLPIFCLIAVLQNWLDAFILAYAVYFGATCVSATIYLIAKTYKANRKEK